MTERPIALALTPAESHLIHALRAIPESPVKSRILEIVNELVRIGEDPRCAEAQADGFPCACSSSQCELCNGVFQRLDAVSDSLLPPRAA
jgi:hypothetical protein